MKPKEELEFEEEVEELIQEINENYGYNFDGYARASVYRRIKRFMENRGLQQLGDLRSRSLSDSFFFEDFLQEITVNVTEMFRDPSFFLALREKVLPMLSTYPYLKIWDAGCSTGEELVSLCILLKEAGLLERTKIYATDINQKVLMQAKEAIFPAKHIKLYTTAYYASGGKQEFSSYFQSNYGMLKFNSDLLRNVIFYPHNLATDFSFNEFHLILCRNVLIYFNRSLQQRVLDLFHESLVPLGYLGLGQKESMALYPKEKEFGMLDSDNRIYRKLR